MKNTNAQHKLTIDGLKSEAIGAESLDDTPVDIEKDAGNAFGGKSKNSKTY